MVDPEPSPEPLQTPVSRRRFLRGSLAVGGVAAGSAIAPNARAAGGAPKVESSCATVTAKGLVAAVLTTAPASVRVEAWPTNAPADKVKSAWRGTNRSATRCAE